METILSKNENPNFDLNIENFEAIAKPLIGRNMKSRKMSKINGRSRFTMYYEDTDLSGFVYHSYYIKFFERARENLVGIEWLKIMSTKAVHFVVTEVNVKYHAPATHGDILDIHTTCLFSRSAIQTYKQVAYLNGKKLVEATIQTASLNSENRPVRVPQDAIDYLISRNNQGSN